jgi:phage shock protein PspC (stress-responsive transcriptional regulator)
MVGGVAGGVADHLAIDPSIVRVVWAALAIFTGGGFFLVYLIMWIVVPEGASSAAGAPAPGAQEGASGAEPGAWNPSVQPARPRGDAGIVVGLLIMGLGAWFLVREFIPALNLDRLWPVGLVALGVVMILLTLRRPSA